MAPARHPRAAAGAALLVATLASAPSAAVETGHMPLTTKEMSRRVPLQRVELAPAPTKTSAGGAAIEIRSGDAYDLAVITGADKAGKPWTVWAAIGGGDRTLYQADLGRERTPALILASETRGNGWAPSTDILSVTFESSGRPLATTFDGYASFDAAGVDQLVDFAGDGGPALVRQSYDDGYWVTSAYALQDGRWRLVHGRYGGRAFPLYTRFTKADNAKATTPARGRRPREDDFSTGGAGPGETTIKSVAWNNDEQELRLALANNRSCIVSFSNVVVDDAAGRRIAAGGAQAEARKLLEEARDKAMRVTLTGAIVSRGLGAGDACRPNAIWARASD